MGWPSTQVLSEYEVTSSTKIKKPNFIKRWLINSLGESMKYEEQQKQSDVGMKMAGLGKITINSLTPSMSTIDSQERALHFTVHMANGGRIVETRRYDNQKDRNINSLYVITNDKDFGHEIDKIITMEALK